MRPQNLKLYVPAWTMLLPAFASASSCLCTSFSSNTNNHSHKRTKTKLTAVLFSRYRDREKQGNTVRREKTKACLSCIRKFFNSHLKNCSCVVGVVLVSVFPLWIFVCVFSLFNSYSLHSEQLHWSTDFVQLLNVAKVKWNSLYLASFLNLAPLTSLTNTLTEIKIIVLEKNTFIFYIFFKLIFQHWLLMRELYKIYHHPEELSKVLGPLRTEWFYLFIYLSLNKTNKQTNKNPPVIHFSQKTPWLKILSCWHQLPS